MVFMYDTGDLSKPLYEDSIDECPAILVPYYDEDSNTVFLSGRVSTCLHVRAMTSDVILSNYCQKNPHLNVVTVNMLIMNTCLQRSCFRLS